MVVFLQVGDHIEKIDGNTVVGCRHFEVAKMLKAIPKGHQFILRVVEPLKAGFGEMLPNVTQHKNTLVRFACTIFRPSD